MLSAIFLLFFFFFSSRRRHTRLQGDWSSDVCSSDLVRAGHVASHVCADAVAYLVRRGCPAKERAERAPHPRHRGRSALCRHSFRARARRSEEHTSELQSPCNLVCRLLLEKKKTDIPATSIRLRNRRTPISLLPVTNHTRRPTLRPPSRSTHRRLYRSRSRLATSYIDTYTF